VMTEEDLINHELENSGTSWTKNEFFDANGYLIIKKICDPKLLHCPVPTDRGLFKWWGMREEQFVSLDDQQVEDSVERYWYPQYKDIHINIKDIVETAIGRGLYETYYYDRFYFPGQELKKHVDRPACEISVTVHIDTNIKENWPIWVKTVNGENVPVVLEPGDAMIYKGCERPHWREPMPGLLESIRDGLDKHSLYYHQIFFHYVLQDGVRAHYAWDKGR
tara:strand:+ start:788 stop:1450 length:663 start_codon:yes stop_codon:yes gene_type:complete